MTTSDFTCDRIIGMDGTSGSEYIVGSASTFRLNDVLGIDDKEFVVEVSDHNTVFADLTIMLQDDDQS